MNIKRLWFKSLGTKASECDKESDLVGVVRTIIFLTYFITNIFIVAGVIKHWGDSNQNQIQHCLDT